LPKKSRCADDVQHFLVIVAKQSKLESVLSGVEGNGARASGSVKAVDGFAFDSCKINGVVERADDAMVAVYKGRMNYDIKISAIA
jgi:hypothetical protein